MSARRITAPDSGAPDAIGHGRKAAARRPWFAAMRRVPPVAFSPDWRALLGALLARNDPMPPAGTYDFDSGRSALLFALERLAEAAPLRRRVVVPAYTCYSVAAAVEQAGLELVVCDIDPRTLDFDPAELASVAGEDTLCIVAAQLFGCGIDLDHAAAVARRAGCHLIEDAAQASDPADDAHARDKVTLRVISAGRGKPLSTGGGGLVSLYQPALRSSFDQIHARVRRRSGLGADVMQAGRLALMKLLVHPRLFWAPAAIPTLRIGATIYPDVIVLQRPEGYRLRLYGRLRARFERERRTRRQHAAAYQRALGASSGAVQPWTSDDADYAPHRFPIYLGRDRDAVAAELARAGRDGVATVYPAPLSHLPRVRHFCANPDAPVPGAAWVARRLVTLPTHGHVDPASRARAIDTIKQLEL